ncbi:uncharacterized protein LOC131226139 [Magnolia sinica]|uniref:uncharacterized protein LOC131226139 n=1 Tax=Magnolia sinica TaxID=86752 RepID=UPI00265AD529|nr:uncharacterized protein LOC131226139 [Magnolia sinica]
MAEISSLMASATFPGIFHQEQGICRASKDFQPLSPTHGTRPEILRSCCLRLGPPRLENSWKSACPLAESNQSIMLASTVKKPVLVDVQDTRPDSVLFSFGIAEQCAKQEKILQYLMSGSKAERGLNISLLSDLMGLDTVAIDMPHLSAADGEFSPYDVGGDDAHQTSLIYPGSGFYVPKLLLDLVGDLAPSSMITVHPDGRVLFTATGADVKDLLSMVAEFYPLKTSTICSKKSVLVPHFPRTDSAGAQANVCGSSLKLQTLTVAPIKSPEKIKLKPLPRKKQSKKSGRERDLYRKSYFHACESLLSVLLNKRRGKMAILSLKKSGPELPQLLTQFSVGIAGTGLAVIFSVFCKVAGGRVPFCATKLLNTGFGLGLVWLSWAFNHFRDTIVYVSKNSSRVVLNEDEIVRKVDRSVNEIFFRAVTLMAVAVLRFA